MNNLIESYVNKLTKDDIIKFAKNNNLNTTIEEINFIYTFIKCNYKDILKDPSSFDLTVYKDKFSKENYDFLDNIIKKYINYIK